MSVLLCTQFWQGSGIQSPWECTRFPALLIIFFVKPTEGGLSSLAVCFWMVPGFSHCCLSVDWILIPAKPPSSMYYIQIQDITKVPRFSSPLWRAYFSLEGSSWRISCVHLFASLIEKYYFYFVCIFLVTVGVKIFHTLQHSSRRNYRYKSCKVHFQLYMFQAQLWHF